MCQQRIGDRITRSGTRLPLKSLLQDATRAMSGAQRPFVHKAKEVVRLIDAWSKHPKLRELRLVVEAVHELSHVTGIRNILDAIGNRDMQPGNRSSLWNIITKVARYKDAARTLHRLAKKYPHVRKMKVLPVSAPPSAFRQFPNPCPTSTLASTLSRLNEAKTEKNLSKMCEWLKKTRQEADGLFVKQRNETLRNAKIHAEVQLVLYCDTHSLKPYPRVVCSSKAACYLCNMFLTLHGKTHMPKQHGKLYPGWRFPVFPGSTTLEQRFVSALEQHVRTSTRTLFKRKARTMYACPNESSPLTIVMSSSTLASVGEADPVEQPLVTNIPEASHLETIVEAEEIQEATVLAEETTVKLEAELEAPSSTSTVGIGSRTASPDEPPHMNSEAPGDEVDANQHIQLQSVTGEEKDKSIKELAPISDSQTINTNVAEATSGDQALVQPDILQKPGKRRRTDKRVILQQDQHVDLTVEANSESAVYEAWPLRLQIEYTTSSSEEPTKKLACTLEHVDSKAAIQLNKSKQARIISIDEMFESKSIDRADLHNFYIAAGETLLRLCVT